MLHGRVRLTSPDTSWDGRPGDHLVIPSTRHGLHAVDDCVARSPSPNLFSSKAHPPWPPSASKVRPTVAGPVCFMLPPGKDPITDDEASGDQTSSTDL